MGNDCMLVVTIIYLKYLTNTFMASTSRSLGDVDVLKNSPTITLLSY